MKSKTTLFTIKFTISLVLYVLLSNFHTSPAFALTMSNSNYEIQMSNLDMTAGKPSNSNYKLLNTGGQTAPGPYTNSNYQVKSGFEYIYPLQNFTFALSTTAIDFGILSATNPVTRTNNITISNQSASGYQVTAYENHQLSIPPNGSLIPDTSCDNGSCTETTAALWTNTLTYGFGYRCDNITGSDCASGFTTTDYYKQFADNSKSETPQAVMSGTNVGSNKQIQITYKVNISRTQPPGTYTNNIIYIATPTF